MSIDLLQSTSSDFLFSFHDALLSYAGISNATGTPTGTLFAAGCQVNGRHDCAAACQGPALVFGNPYTLQNCMVLASLGPAQSNANGSLTLQTKTLTTDLVITATNFSINLTDPIFPSLADKVDKTISGCLQQYCDTGSLCDLSACAWYSEDGVYHYNATGTYCYADICVNTGVRSLNSDIGGIGVWYP